jgi:hypothetical protein
MRRFLRDNGLSLVLFGIFLGTILGQTITGFQVYNDDQRAHNQPPVKVTAYLTTGHSSKQSLRTGKASFYKMRPMSS